MDINEEKIDLIPRVKMFLEKWAPTGHERTWYPNGGDERLVLLWRYFKSSDGESITLQRAKGLKYVLQEIAIAIHNGELIVGEVGLEDMSRNRQNELSAARGYWRDKRMEFGKVLKTSLAEQIATSHGLSHTSMGEKTAASANGRFAKETLSDGGSPSQGANQRGATATLNSLAKANYQLVPGGAAINLRLSPQYLQGTDGIDKLISLLKTYMDMGGEQLQVNVVDTATLKQALENPEQYRDLVVRVAGFTAYFVSLPPSIQQEIIARSESGI